jgi:hypothetical protein
MLLHFFEKHVFTASTTASNSLFMVAFQIVSNKHENFFIYLEYNLRVFHHVQLLL